MTRPLQIYLEDEDFDRLEKWAGERGWSKSQAVRLALRALTRIREEDPLLSASGMIDALPEDLSEDFDRYLQETFIADKKSRYRKSR
ncbi:MAG: ribbon-helix-helix protein, CopG family [Acidobacteria bacterium]|nr:ribbon-helix-helix protein, CopG family [Acidobacteriota bacterium]